LIGTPNSKNESGEIGGEIEFGMESVPTSEIGARSIVTESNEKSEKEKEKRIE